MPLKKLSSEQSVSLGVGMGKRSLRRWAQKFKQEIQLPATVTGVIGSIATGGAAVTAPAWVPVFGIVTGLAAVASIVWAGVASIPTPARRPDEVVGQTTPLKQLEAIEPTPLCIALVGPSQTGKSTLLAHANFRPPEALRTREPTFTVLALPVAPPAHIALLDGAGDQFSQQFSLMRKADIAVLVLDHNRSDSDVSMEPERLQEHARFLEQLMGLIKQEGRGRLRRLWVLLNKQDRWSLSEGKEELRQWLTEVMKPWLALDQLKVEIREHSNVAPADISRFVQSLVSCVREDA